MQVACGRVPMCCSTYGHHVIERTPAQRDRNENEPNRSAAASALQLLPYAHL